MGVSKRQNLKDGDWRVELEDDAYYSCKMTWILDLVMTMTEEWSSLRLLGILGRWFRNGKNGSHPPYPYRQQHGPWDLYRSHQSLLLALLDHFPVAWFCMKYFPATVLV